MVRWSIREYGSPVSLLGVVLLAAVGVQSALDADPLVINALETAVPITVGIAIIYVDRWMAREGFDDERFRGFAYAIHGSIGLTALAIWLVVLRRLNRTRLDEPEFIVLGAATVGAAQPGSSSVPHGSDTAGR